MTYPLDTVHIFMVARVAHRVVTQKHHWVAHYASMVAYLNHEMATGRKLTLDLSETFENSLSDNRFQQFFSFGCYLILI